MFAAAAETSFLLLLDEAQQLTHRRIEFVLAAKDLARMVKSDLGPIQQPMRGRQRVNHFGGEPASFERHDVNAARPGR